jgi:thiol:disulfide interchange protein
MYRTNREVWFGLQKNAGEGLGAPSVISIWTVLLLGGQVLPPAIFLVWLFGPAHMFTGLASGLACLFAYWPRLASNQRFKHTILSMFLHPLGVLLLVALQWWALIRHLAKTPLEWKGRSYPPPGRQVANTDLAAAEQPPS